MPIKPFNPQQFVRNLVGLLELFGPLIFAEPGPGTVAASGPVTTHSARVAVDEAIAAHPGYSPGTVGGPVTEALIARAIRSVLDLALSHAEEAAGLLDRLAEKFLNLP